MNVLYFHPDPLVRVLAQMPERAVDRLRPPMEEPDAGIIAIAAFYRGRLGSDADFMAADLRDHLARFKAVVERAGGAG